MSTIVLPSLERGENCDSFESLFLPFSFCDVFTFKWPQLLQILSDFHVLLVSMTSSHMPTLRSHLSRLRCKFPVSVWSLSVCVSLSLCSLSVCVVSQCVVSLSVRLAQCVCVSLCVWSLSVYGLSQCVVSLCVISLSVCIRCMFQ